MARLFSEGFETQDVSKFTAITNTGNYAAAFVTGRTGGRGSYSLRLFHTSGADGTVSVSKDLGANHDQLYVRFYFKHDTVTANTSEIVRFLDSAGTDVLSVRETSGALKAYRTTSDLGTITPPGWLLTAWTCFEVYAKIDGSETIFTVKIDGSQVFSQTWAATTGAGNLRTVQITHYSRGHYTYIDDIAINDESGGESNSWAGNGSIVALLPTSTASAGMQGSDGNQTDNHLLVDERATDDDTTYTYSGSAAEDRYGLEDLSPALTALESITAVWTSVRARKEGASTLGMRAGLKSGGTTQYETTEATLTSNYYTYNGAWRATDPDTTSAWDESGVNALELIAGVV